MKSAVAEARAAVADDARRRGATVVRGPWPVGIVGLVASRLGEDRGRPAVVGAELGDFVRASCRSDGSLDLAATLEACSDLFIRHGGHAGAAGFEIATERWDAFRERFLALAADRRPATRGRARDRPRAAGRRGRLRAASRARGARAVRPGNPEPLVAVLGLTVTRVRAATGGHTQLTLRRGLDVLDGIAFGRADLAETVHEGDGRRRRAPDEPARSAASNRSSSRSATSRPRAAHGGDVRPAPTPALARERS